jgi:HTH-type transcriptional regulator, competence development regulator
MISDLYGTRSTTVSGSTLPNVVKLTRLRWQRERRALSQKELAATAGVSPVTISRIENGRDEPQPATIRKLAKALGVNPADLMEPED